MNEPDVLQLLGGVLIVLSIMLFVCSKNANKNKQEGMRPNLRRMAMPDIHMKYDAVQRSDNEYGNANSSIYDRETMAVGHVLSEPDKARDITGLRWKSDMKAWSPHQSIDVYDEDAWDRIALRRREIVGDAIETPIKDFSKINVDSASNVVLGRTDYGVQYGDARGIVSV